MADIQQQIDYELKLTGVDSANRQMQGLTQQSTTASGKMTKLSDDFATGAMKANIYTEAIKLAGQAIQLYTNFLRESIQAAIEDQAETRKFLAVFKEFAPGVTEELDALSISAGYSVDSLQNAASALQDFFVPMGIAREQATGMSTDVLKLAADLAAFNGESIEEVLISMRSGFAGMARPMLRFGIDVRAARVEEELLSMGIQGGAEAATAAELAQARLNLMIRHSADASGAAANSMNSMDGMVRKLESTWTDFQEEIGAKFLPILEELFPVFEEGLQNLMPQMETLIDETVDFLEKYGPDILDFAIGLASLFIDAGVAILDAADGVLEFMNAFGDQNTIAQFIENPIYAAIIAITKFVEANKEVNEANQELEESNQRLDESLRQTVISQQYFNDELDVSPRKAMALIEELEAMEFQSGASQDMIEQLRGELGALSEAELDAAIATAEVRIQHMQWASEMTGGGFISSAIQISIGQVQDYITQLQSLKAGLGTTTTTQRSTGSAPAAPEITNLIPESAFPDFRERLQQEFAENPLLSASSIYGNPEMLAEQAIEILKLVKEPVLSWELEAEQANLEARRDLVMSYAQDMSNIFANSFMNGFEDLDKAFESMLKQWMTQMVASGILNLFSSFLNPGKGAMGIFGALF